MRVLLTGAAGFLGSHLAQRLVADGFDVVGVDNLVTGRTANLTELSAHAHFSLRLADVCEPIAWGGPLDWIVHLASPASPIDYNARPIETLRVNGEGTRRMLDLAELTGARFLLASSSEVYGDAQVHPQPEAYSGNVSPTGPRSVYQEAKRYAESLTAAYGRSRGVDVRIARIFNAYGPRMRPDDGRVVSTLITQAIRGEPMTVHGTGQQTRSFQFVDDLVDGLRRLMESSLTAPVNLGSEHETSVIAMAHDVLRLAGSTSDIVFTDGPADDPLRRCPDITLARSSLGWEPVTPLDIGLARTIAHFRGQQADSL